MTGEYDIQEILTFQLTPDTQKNWGDHDIWNVIYSYPDSLMKKFEKIREGLNIYIKEGYSQDLYLKYLLNHKFWKAFYYQLSKNQTLEKSFRRGGGLQGEIGFEWCAYKIQSYYLRYEMIPIRRNKSIFQAM